MTTSLSEDAIRQYGEAGYWFPVQVMSPAEAAGYRARLEAFEAAQGGRLKGRMKQKLHVMLTWMHELVSHPNILDAVEGVLGPDILCWQTSFFIKEARDPGYVSWHQDSTYWGLSTPDVVTAWLAFTPATKENGAMSVVPGTHLWEQVGHRDTFNPDNLLSRGQEIAVDVDPGKGVDLLLEPGQASLHHVRLVHASEPNNTDDRRIGLAIRYVAPHVSQITGVPDSAMLVRGQDRYGNFELEAAPKSDMHPEAVALHKRITETREGFIYGGTKNPRADSPATPAE